MSGKPTRRRRLLWLGGAIVGVGLAGAAFLIGRYTAPPGPPARTVPAPAAKKAGEPVQWYTCAMHPEVRLRDPSARCPICHMELIPVEGGSQKEEGPRRLAMSEAAMALAEVRTERVERRFADVELRLVGKVDYDETRVKTISAWVGGRLERLFVDYTGVPVKRGDHLVEIYSPELYSAQEELRQALQAVKSIAASPSQLVRDSARATVEAARKKLSLLGLRPAQIRAIETSPAPSATIEIQSPIGGIVVHKHAAEGMYVKTGTPIYTVADLSRVWVLLDAYESDLPWVRYGQDVTIRTEAYGDETFQGWVSFVDPVLNPATRTVKVRVIVENPDGRLRPNMFVRAVIRARVGDRGQVVASKLRGKWISPMHPEVVKDGPGKCDVCGMDLVPAESLGYVTEQTAQPPLLVPASAVLLTGKRALVYVRVPKKTPPTFEGLEIAVGPRAGDWYVVRQGLQEGQEVVAHGNFKIDSALQLEGKRSLMSPQGGAPPAHRHAGHAAAAPPRAREPRPPHLDAPRAFRQQVAGLLAAYFGVQRALAADDPQAAKAAAAALRQRIKATDASGLTPAASGAWQEEAAALAGAADALAAVADLRKQREHFVGLSAAAEALVRRFGPLPGLTVRRAVCPMAFDDRGAHWLQEQEEIDNPYFGAAMRRCGEITEVLSPAAQKGDEPHEHR